MANNNNLLFNAALCGFIEAAVEGKQLADFLNPDSQLTTLANTFATAVDSQIAFDNTITTANNNPACLAPTTNTIAANQEVKFELMKGLCYCCMAGRYGTLDPELSTFTTDAQDIANLYNTALPGAVIP